jgi:hypothetical protein
VAGFDAADLTKASTVIARYRDRSIGVADASVVVLADRYHTRAILTLDQRHFGVLRPLSGGRFAAALIRRGRGQPLTVPVAISLSRRWSSLPFGPRPTEATVMTRRGAL